MDDGRATEAQCEAELRHVRVPEELPALLGFVGGAVATVVAVVAQEEAVAGCGGDECLVAGEIASCMCVICLYKHEYG